MATVKFEAQQGIGDINKEYVDWRDEVTLKDAKDYTDAETTARQEADNTLQEEINELKNSPDVVDIVATYADLEAYDTSKLGDKDVIRVLTDETHDNESSYYRWNKPNSQWVFIGAIEGYYTKDQTDTLLAAKQGVLTAGTNISIDSDNTISATDTTYSAGTNISIDADNVISATDTTYSNFTGATSSEAGAAGLVPAPAAGDDGKYLKGDGTWGTVSAGESTIAKELTTDDYNWNSTAGDSTTEPFDCVAMWLLEPGVYTLGSGVLGKVRTGQTASNMIYIFTIGKPGTSGYSTYIPTQMFWMNGANPTLEIGYMRTDGSNYISTSRIVGSIPSVVQTTGTSTTDVMSQNAVTSMVFADPSAKRIVKIGNNTTSLTDSIVIGEGSIARTTQGVAIGVNAKAGSSSYPQNSYSDIAIGYNANAYDNSSVRSYAIAIGSSTEAKGSSVAVGAYATTGASQSVAIGSGTSSSDKANARSSGSIAIGSKATASGIGSVSIGWGSDATAQGEMNIGSSNTYYGYNSSNYRLLTGLYDPQSAHDAATKGYVDSTAVPTFTNTEFNSIFGTNLEEES